MQNLNPVTKAVKNQIQGDMYVAYTLVYNRLWKDKQSRHSSVVNFLIKVKKMEKMLNKIEELSWNN